MNSGSSPVSRNPQMDIEIVNHIRAQRHDFMNEIQVIWGHLQIGKPEEARKYIAGMKRHMDLYSDIFRLGNPTLSLFLYDYICKAEKMGLLVDFSSDLPMVNSEAFISGYHEKLNLMDCLLQKVIEVSFRSGSTVYIDIYSEDNNIYIVFANNPDITDMNFSEDCFEGESEDTRKIADSAKRVGIKSMLKVNEENITAAICFEYEEDN